jgi:hypothetical protein
VSAMSFVTAKATPSRPFLECEALLAARFKVRGGNEHAG